MLRIDPDEKINLDKQNSIFPNSTLTSPMTIIELFTKSYVDSSHEINRTRRGSSSVFNEQDNEFDSKKLTNLDSTTIIRNPSSDNKVSNKNMLMPQ